MTKTTAGLTSTVTKRRHAPLALLQSRNERWWSHQTAGMGRSSVKEVMEYDKMQSEDASRRLIQNPFQGLESHEAHQPLKLGCVAPLWMQ
jgi:hypothetical protein